LTHLLFQLTDICRLERERLQSGPSEADSQKVAKADRQLYLDSDLHSGSSQLQVCLTWYRAQPNSSIEPSFSSIWLSSGFYVFVGLILGLLTMSGVIAYSGDNPVNIIYWLLIFVVLQWLMILFSTTMAIVRPQRKGVIVDRIAAILRSNRFKDLPSKLVSSVLFKMNQWMAVSFLIGATLTFLLAIISQDIAFGWATTLRVDTDQFIQVIHVLTWPWQNWWIDAVPEAELIRQTLFFRITDQDSLTIDPQLYGHWWPFLIACLVFYSLIPRLILLAISQLVFLTAIERACTENSYLNNIVRRMTSANIVMASPSSEGINDIDEVFNQLPTISWSDIKNTYSNARLLCWRTELPSADEWTGLAYVIGTGDYTDDIVMLQEFTNETPLLWLVPGWESPLAELKDLLSLNTQPQFIVLQSLSSESLSEADQISWNLFVRSLTSAVNLSGILRQGDSDD